MSIQKKILHTVEDYLILNRGYLSDGEITDLEMQILYLKHAVYLEQLKTFRRRMEDTFEALTGDDSTDDMVEEFYRSEFSVSWRGKTVTLANGAEVFQAIETILDEEIENEEGTV